MSTGDFLTLATLALAILIVTPFLGRYIHRVMEGERVFLSPILRPVERFVYRVCGVDETAEQDWKGYAVSVLAMAFVAIVAGYVVFRLQDVLPFNQGGIPPMSPDLAFNTSVSFETNTNWQNYSGETGATYLTQATVLAVRNFTSAATGLAGGHRPHPRADPPQHEDPRQLLGRPDPRRPVHPPADLDRRCDRARLAGRAPDLESVAGRDHAPGRHAERSPWARSRPRNGSRRWATTAAASSTPTPPIRSRARRR